MIAENHTMELVVATPGIPSSLPPGSSTVDGIRAAHAMGLRAMEMEWVQRVPLNVHHAEEIRRVSEKLTFHLTVHAPYYINLNAADPTVQAASEKRVLNALTMAEHCGAISVCVHPAFYLKSSPEEAFESVASATERILREKSRLFPHVNLAYETMGKPSQFGTVEEVLGISKMFGIYPCIDPAHLHARTNGKINSKEEWHALFDRYSEILGQDSLKHMHLHFSGIAYTTKGERHHLTLQESDARWEDFLHVLKERKIGGVLVSESPRMEEDALLLQRTLKGY